MLLSEELWIQYQDPDFPELPALTPELASAIDERVAYNDAHRDSESSWEEVKSRILKKRV
jgi:hypothetical protein